MDNANTSTSPLRAMLARCVACAWVTPAQAEAIASCVEVEYDGCPDEVAQALKPLMGAVDPVGAPEGELAVSRSGFALVAVPQWKEQFPDFGDELGIAVPPGWGDESYCNDVCPSFGFDVIEGEDIQHYKLFVDYADPSQREINGMADEPPPDTVVGALAILREYEADASAGGDDRSAERAASAVAALLAVKRFRVALFDESGTSCIRDVYETDDARAMSAFCALIALRDEVLDWQAALGGEREGLDELCSACDAIIDGERS